MPKTGDDGMPVTYDEFFDLCDLMLSKGITPFIWAGDSGYMNKFLSAVAANYCGEEDWSANYDFSGTAKIITDYTTLKEEEVEISPSNGYLLSQQAGKYQALRFLERILSNSEYYYEDSLLKTYSNVDAQEQFVYSKLDNEPIAMIIEGSFWENEARKNEIFERSVRDYPIEAAKNRNFGIMSLPLSNDRASAVGKQSTLADIASSYAFINSNVKSNEMLLKLSKDFLQFAYSDASLIEFTTMTNMTKGVNYKLSSQQYDALGEYGQQIWDLKKSSVVAYELSNSDIFMGNTKIFNISKRFSSVVNGDSYLLPVNALTAEEVKITALDYFKGMKVNANDWTY